MSFGCVDFINMNLVKIGNMDETPLYVVRDAWEVFSSEKEISMTSTGHEKQRITVTLSADGTD